MQTFFSRTTAISTVTCSAYPVLTMRFVNHSDAPNVATDYVQDPYGLDVALRDIAAGEELTMDYANFEQTTEAARGF